MKGQQWKTMVETEEEEERVWERVVSEIVEGLEGIYREGVVA